MKIILIDNYDSFTFNLFHYLSSLKVNVDVVRNDKINSKEIIKKNEIFTEKNIFCIRPVGKLGAENWFRVIGKKSKKKFKKYEQINLWRKKEFV